MHVVKVRPGVLALQEVWMRNNTERASIGGNVFIYTAKADRTSSCAIGIRTRRMRLRIGDRNRG